MNLKKYLNLNIYIQILLFMLPIALFWNAALISEYTSKTNIAYIVLLSILINAVFLCLSVLVIKNTRLLQIKIFFKKYYPVFLIFLLFLICFSTVSDSWLNLDGYTYYSYLREMKYWDFTSFNHFMMAGHMSQGYSIILMIGEFLFPENIVGVRIMHCIMALITILAFYDILYKAFPKISRADLCIYTSIFAFTPLFLGLLSEINTDFPLLCFLVWLVCAAINQKYLLEFLSAFLLCFSKETGCLLYGFFLIGVVLYRILFSKQNNFKDKIVGIFSPNVMIPVLAGLIWITNYFTFSGTSWGDSAISDNGTAAGYKLNSLNFYPDYIIIKLKQMIFMNFNWIAYFLILSLLFSILLLGKDFIKNKLFIQPEILLGIIFSFVAFIGYNIFYITYSHYRYLIPFAFFVSFGIVIAIECYFKKLIIKRTLSICFLILLVISNFYTFDPFSLSFFMKQYTGTGQILIPCTMATDVNDIAYIYGNKNHERVILNTSAFYNFQCAHLKENFDKSLNSIDYTEDTLIILPAQYRGEYGTIASIFGVNIKGFNDLYWNTKTKHLSINNAEQTELFENDEKYQKLNIRTLNNMNELSAIALANYKHVYYFELPFMKEFNHKDFLGSTDILSQNTIKTFSWKWKVDKIK